MRRGVAALVVVAMASGCTRGTGKAVAIFGGVISGGGVVLLVGPNFSAGDGPSKAAVMGILLVPLGLVLGVAGLVTMSLGREDLADDERPLAPEPLEGATIEGAPPAAGIPEPPPDPEAERARLIEQERRRTIAVDMARSAKAAASRGDCATVQVIAGRVQKLDREYYEADFMLSPAIKACLPVTPEATP